MTKAEIEAALLSGANTHTGTTLAGLPRGVAQVMKQSGLIGENHGLTRKGSILAESLRSRQLDVLL